MPSSPEYNSTRPTAHPNHPEQHTINTQPHSQLLQSSKNGSLPQRNSQITPETSLPPKQQVKTAIQLTGSTRIPTEATKQIKIDTKNSEVSRIVTEVHQVEIRLYGRDLPRRLCMRIASGNSNRDMITSMNSRGKSTLLLGRNKVRLHLLPSTLMEMDTTQSTLPPPLLHGSP
jgi:ATPase subunit of ABC transporter with duplicated ATPase domains